MRSTWLSLTLHATPGTRLEPPSSENREWWRKLVREVRRTHSMGAEMITKIILENNLICNLTNKNFLRKKNRGRN